MPSMNHSINHSSQEMSQIDHPDVNTKNTESYLICRMYYVTCKERFLLMN